LKALITAKLEYRYEIVSYYTMDAHRWSGYSLV